MPYLCDIRTASANNVIEVDGKARGDWALLAQAIVAWQSMDEARLTELAHWVSATRETAELRLQSEQMGRSLADWLRNLGAASDSALALWSQMPPSYPMAQALAYSVVDAPIEQAMQSCAFGWAENMTQAALKAVPLGQNSGQRMLAELARHIPEAIQIALQQSDDTRQAFSPMLAILSARHETQ